MLTSDQTEYTAPDGVTYHSAPSNGACGSLLSDAQCAFHNPNGSCDRGVDSAKAPCVPRARDDAKCIVWIRTVTPPAPRS